MDSPVVTALKQERRLLKEILHFAVRELEMLEFGRFEEVEMLLLHRAERMEHVSVTEANVYEKMSEILNDTSLSAEELAELHDLSLQVIKLADCIVAIDEWTSEVADAGDHFVMPAKPNLVV